MTMLGVIGGSGLYDLSGFSNAESLDIETPFGKPSAPLRRGSIGETPVVFVARHGEGHILAPADVPYRANIHALKQLGVEKVLSLSAVGSLREDLPPRSLVVPDQIIDRTAGRPRTFFDAGIVAHVGLADPFCGSLQGSVVAAADAAGHSVFPGGAYVCIEGPQFSTRAESRLYRSWDAAVVGMTAMPEARLAREAELCYATLAMVTDYDVWHDSEADVSVEVVLANLHANSMAASEILQTLVALGFSERVCACGSALDRAIMTDPARAPAEARQRVALLLGDRFAEA